jgi:hypothetical protein
MSKADSEQYLEWKDLPNVYAYREKDEDDFPPKEWEQLKARPTRVEGVYELESIPFFARDLAIGDEVKTEAIPGDFSPVVRTIHKRSGFSTVRIVISENEDREALIKYLTGLGCRLEFCREYEGLVAIAIPAKTFEQVYDYLRAGRDSERWGAEDGFIAADETST